MMTTSYEIYPAIGIARLGRSEEFFPAPEPDRPEQDYVDYAAPVARCAKRIYRGSFRDDLNLLKRQAARFRVFRCERDAQGALESARELRADEARVHWTVVLANRKAAAFTLDDPKAL